MRLDLRNPIIGLGAVLLVTGVYALGFWPISFTDRGREIGWCLQALGFGGAAYLGSKHRKSRTPA